MTRTWSYRPESGTDGDLEASLAAMAAMAEHLVGDAVETAVASRHGDLRLDAGSVGGSTVVDMDAVVKTVHGELRGSVADGVYAFLGVPYAAPPFGANRLRPPQPVEPWSGVRDATRLGPEPPQVAPPATGGPRSGATEDWEDVAGAFAAVDRAAPSEDCLNLNVWTPDPGATGLPVMVWIQGGMFELSSTAAYDGRHFARDGVVCVVINWRPGAEGFLYLGDGIANVGLLDQVAALSGCTTTSPPSAAIPATSPSSASPPAR